MMKKIITISTAVALFGAALLFVGCTKDYGQDLTDVKKDVEELQTSVATANKNIETLQSQVKVLEQAKTDLEAADKELQSKITDLNNNKADKSELATAKAELEKADAALQKQITSVESTLKDIQTTLALKADKSWVEKTFATVEALNKVSEELGTLTGTVSDINVRLSKVEVLIEGLGDDVKDLLSRLKKIEDRLASVESRITQAEKDIVSLGNELHTLYYKKGEVEGLIAASEGKINVKLADSLINIRAAIKVINEKFAKEYKERINADEQLQANISAEAKAREAADEALTELLKKEVERSTNMDDYLKEKILKEIEDRGAAIVNEASLRKSEDDKLYLQLIGEEAARLATDGQLQTAINQEIANRIQALKDEKAERVAEDAELLKAIQEETAARIKALEEEETARKAADKENADAIAKEIQERKDAVKAEEEARIAACNKLSKAIQEETDARIKALEDEETARKEADAALDEKITTEVKKLYAKIAEEKSYLEGLITAEEILRKKGDTELADKLAKAVAALQKADTTLQNNINDEIQARKNADALLGGLIDSEELARKTGDADLANALKNAVDTLKTADKTLQKKIDTEVTERTNADKALNVLITAEEIARENGDVALANALKNAVDELEKADKVLKDSIDTKVKKLYDKISEEVSTLNGLITAEEIAREAGDTKLAGDLATAVTALEAADKTLQANIDKEIKAREDEIARVETEYKAADAYLQKQIDAIEKGTLPGAIAVLQKQIDAITQDITDLKGILVAMMDKVEEKIDDLSARVESISVCPTLNEELVTFTLGSNDMKMLRATFAVAPVDAVDNMIENKDSLTLIYAEGISRNSKYNTKSSVIYKKAKILKVIKDKPYGTLTVIADSVFTSTPTKAMPTAVFFALAWGDYDAAGKARICSDFAQAVEYNGAFDLLKGFKYAYNKDTVNIKFVPKDDFVNESTRDFVQAETDSVAPFNDKMVAYDNSGASPLERLFLLDDYYTVYKLGRILNHEFEVTAWKDYKTPPVSAYSGKGYGTFDIKFLFQAGEGEKLSKYVNKNPWTIDFYAKVDEHYLIDAQEEKSYLTHNAYITPVDRGTYNLGTYNIDWNYETYKPEDRKVEIAPETKEWKAAKDAKCKVMKKLGNSDLLDYNDWNDNDSTKCYDPIKLSLNGNEYEGDPFDAVKDTVYKQCDSVKYAFAFETTADTPQKDITVYDIQTIPGSLTLAREIIVKDFYKIILAKNPDAAKTPAKDIYIHGAKDTTYASVLKAAQAKIEAKNCVLTVDGSTNIKKFTYEYNSSKDEMKFNIIAGEWGYSADHTITFYVADVFGFKYETIVKVKTGDPKFGLGTKNWIVKTEKGLLGTARGAIVGNVYTLEDMYYNKQVEVVNLDSLNKYETVAEGDLVVKFDTVTLKNLYPKADGKIGIAAGKAGVIVNPKDGSLTSDILTWGDYNGRMFKLKAQLYLKKDTVGEPIEYYIMTQKPVKYVSNNDINKTRTPKVDLPIKLYENAVVYGVVDGQFKEENVVKPDGTISKYDNTYFEYAEPKDWKVTLNGSAPQSWIENVDYKFDRDKQILTIMGDNLKGELQIVMGTMLHYYLDAGVPKEMDLTINVTQK